MNGLESKFILWYIFQIKKGKSINVGTMSYLLFVSVTILQMLRNDETNNLVAAYLLPLWVWQLIVDLCMIHILLFFCDLWVAVVFLSSSVILECINWNYDFIAFVRSNILILISDEVDILWDVKDQYPKYFKSEVSYDYSSAIKHFLKQ